MHDDRFAMMSIDEIRFHSPPKAVPNEMGTQPPAKPPAQTAPAVETKPEPPKAA